MTVFNGYMGVTWRNRGTIIMYFIIFVSISLSMQFMRSDQSTESFKTKSLSMGVVDNDKSALSEAVIDYLEQENEVELMENDESLLQETLYYYQKDIIVQIPEGFEEKVFAEECSITVTGSPGQYADVYVEQKLDEILNAAKKYMDTGYTVDESFEKIEQMEETKVELYDVNGNGGEVPGYADMFRFFPYLSVAVLCCVLGMILVVFRGKEVKNRMMASAVPLKKQSAEAFLAFFIIGTIMWIVVQIIAVICYGTSYLQASNFGYYLLNSFMMMLVSLSLSFFIGMCVKTQRMVTIIVTPLSLAMCFLGGAFVPLSIMNDKIKMVSRFIPTYWYENNNDILTEYQDITGKLGQEIWCGIGIQLLFCVMFVGFALAISRYKQQEQ